MTILSATSAANRFGVGARPGDLEQIDRDPHAWLLAQLRPAPLPAALTGLPSSADYLGQYRQVLTLRQQVRKRGADGDAQAARMEAARLLRQGVLRELMLRQQVAVTTADGFRERLVRFWSNHFAISVDKRVAALFAAPMEREAIRPHVTGRFVDLLRAVERHPGMLLYLDNAQSVGDDSPAAQRARRRMAGAAAGRRRGLNENLAREILELHTVGVDAGYTQQNVTEFARAITGWSVAPGAGDAFVFRAAAHEPGARRVLGKTYRQAGEQQGLAILDDLAVHPATAGHVSLKLARHFVADTPPPALVARMRKAWLDSGGDLPTVYRTMLEDPAAWQAQARKFRTPDDFILAALRACGLHTDDDLGLALRLQGQLGQPVFQPRSPAGFGDLAADWGGPDALFKRVQAAQALANRMSEPAGITPLALGQAVLGEALDGQTATALRRAESIQQGVALLLASPAFQWRA
ncbi:MAG: DUF1800 domain-containing protein [Thermomonas hydrothermalis]|uniref:DUF1800 domain-containing protein n=1 Tax=Thermomonas hydrothermalis TaxID=213588 RepID=UPI002352DC2C|nr:DUF1800 domain-containing protein [Thermomonas hydrothermalis]MCL6618869.1 DUF1800 domain-containing protein [Thermomonas hydrothermalis]